MLQADERDAPAAHDELAGVRGTHTHCEVEVHGAVGFEQLEGAAQCVFGDLPDVHVLEQPPQVGAVCPERLCDHPLRVRRVRVEHVVVPVALEDGCVAVEIRAVRRDGVGRGHAGEELRDEIDEHGAGGRPQFGKLLGARQASLSGW